jgi:hypothetical protein
VTVVAVEALVPGRTYRVSAHDDDHCVIGECPGFVDFGTLTLVEHRPGHLGGVLVWDDGTEIDLSWHSVDIEEA